jgi:hypothetical protein
MTYQQTLKEIIDFIVSKQLAHESDSDTQELSEMIKKHYWLILEHMEHFPGKCVSPKMIEWFLGLGELLGVVVRIDK